MGDDPKQGDLQARGVQFYFPRGAYQRPFAGVDLKRGNAVAHPFSTDDGLHFGYLQIAHLHSAGDADIKIKVSRQLVAGVETVFADGSPSVHQAGMRDVENIIVRTEESGMRGRGLISDPSVQHVFGIPEAEIRPCPRGCESCDSLAIWLAQCVVQAEKGNVAARRQGLAGERVHRLVPGIVEARVAARDQFASGALDG